LASLCLGVVLLAAPLRDWQSLDLRNYLAAAALILRRESPYGRVEFFAPPWMAALLAPLLALPLNLAGLLWTLLSTASVIGTAWIAVRWIGSPRSAAGRALIVAASALLPAALFVYVTGQASALVGLAAVWMADLVRRGHLRAGWLLLAVLGVTLKPHIVAFPAALCLLELIRRRAWKPLARVALGLAGVALLALAILPGWPSDLLGAWRSGDFRGGSSGLVSPGYFGLAELGLRPWIFIPLPLYALYRWWMGGLTLTTISLALGTGLVLTPYSRSYDYVLLILPLLALLLTRSRRALGAAAGAAGLLLPLTNLSLLAPVAVVLGFLVQPDPAGRPSELRPKT
jgi:hypothetical protein